MAKRIVVGARRVRSTGDLSSDPADEALSFSSLWVRIGDLVLNAGDYAIKSVSHSATHGVHEVTITLFCDGYEVVDAFAEGQEGTSPVG